LIGSGTQNGKKICWLNLITGESVTLAHDLFAQPEGRPLISPDSSFALVPNALTNTVEYVQINHHPKEGSVNIIPQSFSSSSLFQSPLSGTFSVDSSSMNNSLIALIPSEMSDRITQIDFSSCLSSRGVKLRRSRVILDFAIALDRYHVCERQILIRILQYSPRIGLSLQLPSSPSNLTQNFKNAIRRLSPSSLRRRRKKKVREIRKES